MKFNFKGVSKSTWVRVIVMFLVLVNLVSTNLFNYQLIPFSDEQISNFVSTGLTVVITIWTAYKNNSVTAAAQEADKVMKNLKGGK